ncbi:MAG: ATP-binding protein [Desertimonas sp.]
MSGSIWDGVVGQPDARRLLRAAAAHPVHAYLLVGPPGSTKTEAARAFAAALVSSSGDDPDDRDARLALAGAHPDVREVQRAGAAISADQAREIVRLASLAPVEGARKVMILHEFHLLRPEGAALLLKTLEEPPASTVFVVLADFVPADLVTISSRCVRVPFRALSDEVIAAQLAAGGLTSDRVAEVVAAAGGDLDRARLLAGDEALAARRAAFRDAPRRLDGSGRVVMELVDELLGMLEAAAAPLTARHDEEVVALDARAAQFGERGSGRKALEERHTRELRRHRTDELRAGLTVLAGSYRDALVANPGHRPDELAGAVHRVIKALEGFEFNPNEKLLMQSLLWDLPSLAPRRPAR